MKLQFAIFALLVPTASATITTSSGSAEQLVQTLLKNKSYLNSVKNIQFTGNDLCAAIFEGGKSSVPDGVVAGSDFPDAGIILSTGRPNMMHIQDMQKESTTMRAYGDSDLEALVGGTTYDACILEFDFVCASPADCEISFDYVFGSDEYNSMVSNTWNDAFAWILNGQNIALIPQSSTFVSIDTINLSSNSNLFVNNDPSSLNPVPFPEFQADGFTHKFTATGTGNVGMDNHMKLVIADRADNGFDSWVILGADTFELPPPPPPSGGAGGDPHFKRFGQSHRDSFHGECDLVVMQSKQFHNQAGIDFHIRTTLFDNLYSYIESAALKIGGNILEVNNGHFLLNGAKYDDKMLPTEFGDDQIYKFDIINVEQHSDGTVVRRNYRLTLGETKIEFKFYKHILTFEIAGASFEGGSGMLGAFPTGDMVSRSGKTMNDFTEFGFEWQVGHEDPILFTDLRAPQLPYERCRMPVATAQVGRRRLRGEKKSLLEDAQKACAHVLGGDFDLCVDDVVVTGDLELAKEW